MEVQILSYILVAHYISDFLLQTRKMGVNKSSSIKWLSIHVSIYTLSLFIMITIPFLNDVDFLNKIIFWVFVNGLLHWITDFITSKLSGLFYKKENMYMFWSIIGLDQLIHILTLIWTYKFII